MIVKIYNDTGELVGEILNAKNAHKEDAELRIYSKALEVCMESYENFLDIFEFLKTKGFHLKWPQVTIGKLIYIDHKPTNLTHIIYRLLVGWGMIFDGLIRVLTYGYISGGFELRISEYIARRNQGKKHGH